MRYFMLTAAVFATFSFAARADELTDLKTQLENATKSIQGLQKRVLTLEARKAERKRVAAPYGAAAALPPPPPAAAPPETAPVVAPNQHLTMRIPGIRDGYLELFGTAQVDGIYDFKRVNPQWKATLRPSTIPVNCPPVGTDPGCGTKGETIFSVRQTTLGVNGVLPTELGVINTKFEFDLFGQGNDAGNTSFRLKHAYGSLGQFLAGQTYTLMMDIDAFPNTIDFWGPSGLMFLYDPQFRWTPIDSNGNKLAIALEAPGTAIDTGKVANLIPELAGITERKKYPDITGQFRVDRPWGHMQVAGVARWVSFDNPAGIGGAPARTLFGSGVSLTGHLNVFAKDAIRGSFTYGRGIASYSNDCCVDLAPDANLRAVTVPLLNWMAYYDHWWNEKWSSAIGYSQNNQDNTAGQFVTAQNRGSYASVNLLYRPVQNMLIGVEGLWGERVDKDGNKGTDQRMQFTSKFTF